MLMGNVSSATRSCERFLLLLPLVRRKSVSATAGEVNSAFPLKEIKSGTQSATDACGKRVFRSSSSISSFPVVFLSFFSRATFVIIIVVVVVVEFEANSCAFSQANWEQNGAVQHTGIVRLSRRTHKSFRKRFHYFNKTNKSGEGCKHI